MQNSQDEEMDTSIAGATNEEGVKKKRKYTRKKATKVLENIENSPSSNLEGSKLEGDESQSMSNLGEAETPGAGGLKKSGVAGGRKTPLTPTLAPLTPFGSGLNRGRKKSTQHLVKLLKKTKRKKRKKTSSGEEDEEDDDSDDYEIPVARSASKIKAESVVATAESASNPAITETDSTAAPEGVVAAENGCGSGVDDEAAAKLLQASEKRRSTRTTAAKRQKYTDEDYKLREEDLLMPQQPGAEQEEPEPVTHGSIVFASHDSLIVDKILGVRLAKHKTKRRKEKQPKEAKKPEVKEEKKTENEAATPMTNGDEKKPIVENGEKEKEETAKEEQKEAAKVESPKPVQEAKMEGVEEAVVDEKQPTIEKVEEKTEEAKKDEDKMEVNEEDASTAVKTGKLDLHVHLYKLKFIYIFIKSCRIGDRSKVDYR